MVAPAAIQQGLRKTFNGSWWTASCAVLLFEQAVAIIGRNAAAAHVGRLTFAGFPAWILWLGVHLLPDRLRLFVLINWIWDYFFHARGVRLILPPRSKGRIFMVQKD